VTPAEFLARSNTLNVVSSASAQQTIGPLVSAAIEDITEQARRDAAGRPGGRRDPPLGLILDELANVEPPPTLPTLVSDGGGSGIWVTWVVQSLAQVEQRWGDTVARSAWDPIPVPVVFGGGAENEPFAVSPTCSVNSTKPYTPKPGHPATMAA
jgi:type IV secretory pathway TraG/TraD family ATPase VirD4